MQTGKTLTVKSTSIAMLASQGKLVAQAGSTLKLPNSSGREEVFIGGQSDTDARFQLTSGSVSFDMGKKDLTLTENSVAAIPNGKTTYLMFGSGAAQIALNATIAEGATLTVNGTLKAVSGKDETGTQLTVNGELDASNGTLIVADKASVEVNGTLSLPLMSRDDINGTDAGTGLLGDIVINGGAAVKYGATYTVVASISSLLSLSDDARVTLNLADASLSLNKGDATVNSNMFTMLPLKGSESNTDYLRLAVTIDAGTIARVPSRKTLKVVTDSSMTINGTLDVAGTLTIAQGVAEFSVEDGGKLALPAMSKETMTGTVDGTGLRGDIKMASGAAISYGGVSIPDDSNAYLTLSEDGDAVANFAESSLELTAGSAAVNDDSNGKLKALLVASDGIVPLQIETVNGTTVSIPAGKALSIPNNAKLEIGGALNVVGVLEVHSTATLSGDVTVNGTVAVYGSSTEVNFNLAASGAKVLANGDIAKQISSAADIKTPSDLSYTSIVNSVDEKTFKNGWEYHKSTGNGSGGGSSSYAVSVSSTSNGSVSVSPKSASKGDTETITVTPDKGYELDSLTVTDKDGKYTFVMPAGKVTVKVTFAEVGAEPETPVFTDVSDSAYYYDAVKWAVEKGVTNGTSATTFTPDMACTRAQMVTFLWRANGSPKAAGVNPFTDVSADAYYYDAVLWAVKNGITSGTSATTFAPNATVTRGQTVTFLYRANGSPAVSSSSFSDVAADAHYANAVAWAVSEGVTNGTSATTVQPGCGLYPRPDRDVPVP